MFFNSLSTKHILGCFLGVLLLSEVLFTTSQTSFMEYWDLTYFLVSSLYVPCYWLTPNPGNEYTRVLAPKGTSGTSNTLRKHLGVRSVKNTNHRNGRPAYRESMVELWSHLNAISRNGYPLLKGMFLRWWLVLCEFSTDSVESWRLDSSNTLLFEVALPTVFFCYNRPIAGH